MVVVMSAAAATAVRGRLAGGQAASEPAQDVPISAGF
jgi:hypothetical protein